jgi:dephospho-CoA kinase
VDRRELGRIVFAHDEARAALEAIVHPAVYGRIAAWLASRAESGASLAVADIPLLYETGREGEFDAVVVVACDPGLQVQRLMARDGLPEAAAHARLAAQWPIERKVERADFVIRTDGTFEETDRQIEDVLARLLVLAT